MFQSPYLLFPPFFLASLHYWLLASYSTLFPIIATGNYHWIPAACATSPWKKSQPTDQSSIQMSLGGEREKKKGLENFFYSSRFSSVFLSLGSGSTRYLHSSTEYWVNQVLHSPLLVLCFFFSFLFFFSSFLVLRSGLIGLFLDIYHRIGCD